MKIIINYMDILHESQCKYKNQGDCNVLCFVKALVKVMVMCSIGR